MTTTQDHPAKTNWPVKLYIGALLWAFASLVFFTTALDGPIMNAARSGAQAAVCGVLGLRLAWALHRREQSKAWIPYVVAMFLAMPIWILAIEPLIDWLGR